MEYVLFIHNNVDAPSSPDQWDRFFSAAKESELFLGGSEINNCIQFGLKPTAAITDSIGGYMKFETDDLDKLRRLLELHPILLQGGTLELCEMPKT